MSTAHARAEGYRKEAQTCFDLADRMSMNSDRARLIEMGQHWLRMAEMAEAKAVRSEDADE